MVVLDEKSASMQPPPAYAPPARRSSAHIIAPPPFPTHLPSFHPTLANLPAHILLHIVYALFPAGQPVEYHRRVLYWISTSLRLVNRPIYVASMHVLRSTYLPAYTTLVRPPFTTDPFPYSSNDADVSSSTATTSLVTADRNVGRETAILDMFLAAKVREDVYADESEFHLEREETFRDIFDLLQPRARMEDLVRKYGLRERVIAVPPGTELGTPVPPPLPPPTSSSATHRKGKPPETEPPAVPFSALSVSFSSRRVGLVLATSGTRRTIVEVQRERTDPLETSAKRLVKGLKAWLQER